MNCDLQKEGEPNASVTKQSRFLKSHFLNTRLLCCHSTSMRQPNSCSPVLVSTCLALGFVWGKFPPEHRAGRAGWRRSVLHWRAHVERLWEEHRNLSGSFPHVICAVPVKQFLIVLKPRGIQDKETGSLNRSRCRRSKAEQIPVSEWFVQSLRKIIGKTSKRDLGFHSE